MTTKKVKSKLDGQKFDTIKFRCFDTLCIGYQMGDKGSHRLALLSDGEVIAAGSGAPLEFPIFLQVGVKEFFAISRYFEGETAAVETPYEMMSGTVSMPRRGKKNEKWAPGDDSAV